MEYGIETVAQNPQVITIILVVTFSILALFVLWAVSRLFAGRKGLDKERRVLDAELYKLEKLASMKKKEQTGDKESVAESFWPKQDQGLATAAVARRVGVHTVAQPRGLGQLGTPIRLR